MGELRTLEKINGKWCEQCSGQDMILLGITFSVFRMSGAGKHKHKYVLRIGEICATNLLTKVEIENIKNALRQIHDCALNPADMLYKACKYLEGDFPKKTVQDFLNPDFYGALDRARHAQAAESTANHAAQAAAAALVAEPKQALSWVEWVKKQFKDHPIISLLVTAAAVAAVSYAGYKTYKYFYPDDVVPPAKSGAGNDSGDDADADDDAHADALPVEFTPPQFGAAAADNGRNPAEAHPQTPVKGVVSFSRSLAQAAADAAPKPAYPHVLNRYRCHESKVTASNLANTLWFITGSRQPGMGPETAAAVKDQFFRWADATRKVRFTRQDVDAIYNENYGPSTRPPVARGMKR